jgi:DNA-binding NtrC family response regulator
MNTAQLFLDNLKDALRRILPQIQEDVLRRQLESVRNQITLFGSQLQKGETDLDALALDELANINDPQGMLVWLTKQTLLKTEQACWLNSRGQIISLHPPSEEMKAVCLEIRKATTPPLWIPCQHRYYLHVGAINRHALILGPFSESQPQGEAANRAIPLFQKLSLWVSPLIDPAPPALSSDHELVAEDPSIQQLLQEIDHPAKTDVTILLSGESGTGKEVLAKRIHHISPRRHKPMIAVNCAAIPEGLIESELFGHEKGSFTGAFSRQIGKIESADQGTLFLDEIGEMDLKAQAKLLRFLQLKEIHRVGGRDKIKVDVRIIAATNRNLKNRVEEGLFREDLYFRLSVFPFTLPPLRQRQADILPLLFHFFVQYSEKFQLKAPPIAPATIPLLLAYDYPGNIRELENLAQNILVKCQGQPFLPHHLPSHFPGRTNEATTYTLDPHPAETFPPDRDLLKWDPGLPKTNEALKALKTQQQERHKQEILALEKGFVLDLLQSSNDSISKAAETAGINRTMLYKMMNRCGVSTQETDLEGPTDDAQAPEVQ